MNATGNPDEKEDLMTRRNSSYESKNDTIHAVAAEQHALAAYEHWAAHYRQKQSEGSMARKFIRKAYKISMRAAELSKQALRFGPDVQSGVKSGMR
jgi:hypothetical protein